MLSRRHIRIKVLQALYTSTRQGELGGAVLEKNLISSIERIEELYGYELKLLDELRKACAHFMELAQNRKLAANVERNPNRKMLENRFLLFIEENDAFASLCRSRGINWTEERDIIRSLFLQIKEDELYKEYLSNGESSWEDDKRFIRRLYDAHVVHNEDFHQIYEDKNLHWADDLDAAQMMVEKTLRKAGPEAQKKKRLLVKLYKDAEDRAFGPDLLHKTLKSMDDSLKRISAKARNWEMDRIAVLDVLLMQMALAEFQFFPTVPLKVSMNEYIELSKGYSTPKSAMFVNGVMDKVLLDLKKEGKIKKIGRGLLDH
jgi:N utilization substance protein B